MLALRAAPHVISVVLITRGANGLNSFIVWSFSWAAVRAWRLSSCSMTSC